MNTWRITSRLPDEEPNAANFAAYSQPQLIAGASPDARYLFDAVYDHNAQCFVLTLLDVNETFGFVENETRLYPTSRAELLRLIADFQAAPAAFVLGQQVGFVVDEYLRDAVCTDFRQHGVYVVYLTGAFGIGGIGGVQQHVCERGFF